MIHCDSEAPFLCLRLENSPTVLRGRLCGVLIQGSVLRFLRCGDQSSYEKLTTYIELDAGRDNWGLKSLDATNACEEKRSTLNHGCFGLGGTLLLLVVTCWIMTMLEIIRSNQTKRHPVESEHLAIQSQVEGSELGTTW